MEKQNWVVICETWDKATNLAESLGFTAWAETVTDEDSNPQQIPMVLTDASMAQIAATLGTETAFIFKANP